MLLQFNTKGETTCLDGEKRESCDKFHLTCFLFPRFNVACNDKRNASCGSSREMLTQKKIME